MSDYKLLADKFKKDVEELRKTCKHEIWSEWIPMFADVAYSKYQEIRYCKNCHKYERR
jgi:hypothetical protein